jgi:hypothetical protein
MIIGRVTTLRGAAGLPRQLVPDGRHRVMFPTGDNVVARAFSLRTGTLRRLNLKTGKLTTYAAAPHRVTLQWATIADTNGIAIDAKRGAIYVDRTFTAAAPATACVCSGNRRPRAVPVRPTFRHRMSDRHRTWDPSDVAIGTGHGWRKGALFVSGFDGTVREFVRK